MKILLIHNFYKDRGGEDVSVECQQNLLRSKGLDVIQYIKKSSQISGLSGKAGSALKLFKSRKTYEEIDSLVKEERPDLAHIHNIYPLITSSVYDALYDNDIPIIQTLHNYRLFCSNGLCLKDNKICIKCHMNSFSNVFNICRDDNRIYDFLMGLELYLNRRAKVYEKVDRFIALSDFQKDKIAHSGITREKIDIIRNICPCTPCQSIEANFSSEGRYFTYMGRLSQEKGIMELVKLFEKLPEYSLKVLGDGPLFDEIANYIMDNGLKNITLTGYVCGEKKFEILSSTFAMIVPSICFEVSPVVIPESLALGIPVIVNNIGALPENIHHGRNGFIYNDSSDLAGILKELKSYTEERLRQLHEDCLASYKDLFDPDQNLEKLLEVYMSVKNRKMRKTEVLNLNINTGGLNDIVDNSIRLLGKGKRHYICVPNAYLTVVANKDRKVLDIINDAEFVIPDGMPLVWYSKTKKDSLGKRISGFELFYAYCVRASADNLSCYLFGAKDEDIARKIIGKMKKDFPGLRITGHFVPPFVDEFKGELNKRIISDINSKKPDIVWVGLSAPKQEKWIADNIGKLNIGMACGVGAVFNFYSGSVRRAPRWMQKSGLEWFYRMLMEPRRLFKKYLVYNSNFLAISIKDLLLRMVGKK